jgi:aspartyl-tRNA(Asn)/glutamyl-tRNA(Gln) amidotransferase subunit B
MSEAPYEIIIGLEVHVQLATATKLFCRCSTAFGAPPNTQTCPVCLGLPGALPVLNRQAFLLGMRTGLALNCQIPPRMKWDRKNYFYPDLPKGYQISQFDLPLASRGWLDIPTTEAASEFRRIRILRAHLEEDAGKSLHDEAAGRHDSRIDLNRTGTPLLEIVSEPDLRSPQEAKSFLTELKLLLTYLGVSDCNMQEGSLRVDANVNLHLSSSPREITTDITTDIATPIVEIKNMNSFRAVERALEYEVIRQYEAWQEDGLTKEQAAKQTRGWDDQAEVTRAQRQKEESSDYRYFPDPDLAPVTVSSELLEQVRGELGELPAPLRQRLQSDYELDAYGADVLVNQGRGLVDYFLAVADQSGDAKRAGNWIQQEVLRVLKERDAAIAEFPISASSLSELLQCIDRGELTNSRAKDVFQQMLSQGQSVEKAMEALGISQVDSSELESLCRELLAASPRIVADVQAGKQQAVGALIGQAKKRNPNANPAEVKRICLELIAEM